MLDTTNLLDADGDQIVAAWFTNYTDSPRNALCRLRDEIVRQARDGMVPEAVLHDTRRMKEDAQTVAREQFERSNALEAENARLRAEMETAKRVGAREALTRLAHHQFGDDWSKTVIAQYLDSEYPAPAVADTAERSVVAGEYEVWYEAGHLPWKAKRVHLVGGTLGRVQSASCHALPSLLDCIGLTPTADEYRRIVAMGGGK